MSLRQSLILEDIIWRDLAQKTLLLDSSILFSVSFDVQDLSHVVVDVVDATSQWIHW